MNISSIFGFLIASGVLYYAAHEAKGAEAILLNPHALSLVLGGTLAATFVSFPIGRILSLSFVAFRKLLGLTGIDYEKIIQEVIGIAEGLQSDPGFAKTAVAQIKHPFLKEGLELMIQGVTEEQLLDILDARVETTRRRYSAEVNMFRTIGKFPPAFGLLGTTFGMIALLNQLGGADAQKMIGPAMAIGLVATLYGIGLTNFIFIPIAENLNAVGAEDYAARRMIVEGLQMIKRKTHPILVEEKMKSYLLPSERAAIAKSKAKK